MLLKQPSTIPPTCLYHKNLATLAQIDPRAPDGEQGIHQTEMGQPFACCNATKPYILQCDKPEVSRYFGHDEPQRRYNLIDHSDLQ